MASAVALLLFAAPWGGCASPGIQVREYVLGPVSRAEGAAPEEPGLAIGVGPIQLPRYLRRSGLVTRVGDHELSVSDEHRWGEDLDRGLARVITENLSALLPEAQVRAFPWQESARDDLRVTIDVERFERGQDGSVTLDARWTLWSHDPRKRVAMQRTRLVEPSAGDDYADSVGAMSRVAGQLSREIAAAIRAVPDEG